MNILDCIVIAAYFLFVIGIGVRFTKKAGKNLDEYFLSGRELPWWLAGVSMVATTFAADTPLAVTGIIATSGIAGNWLWWNFLLSGMFTVFFFAHLWRRAGVMTDVEFAEIRYSGTPAKILRGFRALYLAIPINVVIMGWVTVGMAKVVNIAFGWDQWQTLILLYGITALYILLSGMWGVVLTDFIQFFIAMAGSVVLAVFAVKEVGGIAGLKSGLIEQFGENHHLLDMSPFSPKLAIATVLVWIGMQWWASWYPGAEPGGGGYIAQRMFSAKNEKHSVLATLFFNVAHYALRPWPWILVGLASLVVFPGLDDSELGYPKMMVSLLPNGLLGLLTVAFLAAFMSTISTHLNWGASYIVNDFYKRFLKPKETDAHYVFVSRIAIIFLMGLAIGVSYVFESVKGGWEFLLAVGAGTGLVYILRWYWWRINAWSEISAMVAAFLTTVVLKILGISGFAPIMIWTTFVTTIVWTSVTFLTKPESNETLFSFVNRVRPGGFGWRKFSTTNQSEKLLDKFWMWIAGCVSVYSFLFGIGKVIFGEQILGFSLIIIGFISGLFIVFRFKKL